MKTERSLVSTNESMSPEIKEAWRELLLCFLMKYRSVEVKNIGLSTEEWDSLKESKLLPPGYLLDSGKKLRVAEFVWLLLVKKLLDADFKPKIIHRYKSQFFARYIAYSEEEQDPYLHDTGFVAFENLLRTCFISEKDITLAFYSDGRIEIDPSIALLNENSEDKCLAVSLFEVMADHQGIPYSKEDVHQVEVDKAELALLAAVRNPLYQEVYLEKIAGKRSYRWVLRTVQKGTACAKTLHELVAKFRKGFGEFKITGIGTSLGIPYSHTVSHRL